MHEQKQTHPCFTVTSLGRLFFLPTWQHFLDINLQALRECRVTLTIDIRRVVFLRIDLLVAPSLLHEVLIFIPGVRVGDFGLRGTEIENLNGIPGTGSCGVT